MDALKIVVGVVVFMPVAFLGVIGALIATTTVSAAYRPGAWTPSDKPRGPAISTNFATRYGGSYSPSWYEHRK